jgi:hypothetical protein
MSHNSKVTVIVKISYDDWMKINSVHVQPFHFLQIGHLGTGRNNSES